MVYRIASAPELRAGWLDEATIRCHGELPPIGPSASHSELRTFLGHCPLRVDGLCNTTAPARRQLSNGAEVLCHRTEIDLTTLQAAMVREGTLLSLSPERLLRGQPERPDWPVFERTDGKVSTGIWSGAAGAWRIDFPEGQFEFFHVLSGTGTTASRRSLG